MAQITDEFLFEAVQQEQVDAENGVIHDVAILGAESKNNRTYTERALDDAVKLYEGMTVKLDHPDPKNAKADRSVRESFGELRNLRKKDGKVRGDHHFPVSHAFAAQYVESALRFPRQIGFSHNADGASKLKSGKQIVESLHKVRSVDLVDKPATNESLFESGDTQTIEEAIEGFEPVLAKVMLENLAAGIIAPTAPVAPGAGSADQVKQSFRQAVMAVFDDDSLDTNQTLERIKEIMGALDRVNGVKSMADEQNADPTADPAADPKADPKAAADPKAKPPFPPKEDEKTLESLREELASEREQRAKLQTAVEVGALLESGNKIASDEQRAILESVPADQRKAIVLLLPTRAPESNGRPRPSVSQSILESQSKPKDGATNRWTAAVERAAK